MDIDNLISAIFVRSPIWDKRNKNHSNRNVVEKCWKEISKEVNAEGK